MALREVYPMEIEQGYTESEIYVLKLYSYIDHKFIPIIVGENELNVIAMAMDFEPKQRPQTHELMLNILQAYDVQVDEVTIDRFEEGIFYATLHLSDGFTTKHLDCRASDAIALALMSKVSIKMEESVIEETGYSAGNEEIELEMEDSSGNMSLEELQAELLRCEEAEDYERAAELMKLIDEISNQ